MKPHKHAKLIKAWADGAEIQYFNKVGECWVDARGPVWSLNTEYRVKPRILTDGAWYPVKLINGDKSLLVYNARMGGFIGDTCCDYFMADIVWVGEKLDIDWESE